MTDTQCAHEWELFDSMSAARCETCGEWRTHYDLDDEQRRKIDASKARYRDGFMSGYARAMADHDLGGKDFARKEWDKMKVLADDY